MKRSLAGLCHNAVVMLPADMLEQGRNKIKFRVLEYSTLVSIGLILLSLGGAVTGFEVGYVWPTRAGLPDSVLSIHQ